MTFQTHIPLLTMVCASQLFFHGSLNAVEPVYEKLPEGETRHLQLSMGGEKGVDLLIGLTGETITSFGLLGEFYLGDNRPYGYQLSGNSLKGSHLIRKLAGKTGSIDFPLELDLKLSGNKVSGDAKKLLSKGVNNTGAVAGATDETGSVSGVIASEKELAASNAFTGKGSWDSYVGSNQNFSSVDVGAKLGPLSEAKPVWAAPHIGGMQVGDTRHGIRLFAGMVGGAATPLIADGRVYQFHTEPVGDEIQPGYTTGLDKQAATIEEYAKATGRDVAWIKRRFAIHADEVMTCLDAATGKIVWRTRWPSAGLNLPGHKDGFSNHTGAVGDGKVFVFGSLGDVRALDATTGKQLWSTPIPGYSDRLRQIKESLLGGKQEFSDRSYAHGLNYVAGVVLAPGSITDGPMVGIDASSGKVLWTAGTLGYAATPLRWSSGGRNFAIGSTMEQTVCVDVKTGKVAWTITDPPQNGFTPSIEGDFLLTGAGCYRMTPSQAEKLWDMGLTATGKAKTPFPSRAAGILYRGKAWIRGGEGAGLIVRDAATGKELHRDATRASKAEAYTMAAEGFILYNHEAQHNAGAGFEKLPVADDPTKMPTLGSPERPPYINDLAYVTAVMYPIVEGRIFMRSIDTLFCFDLRK